MTFTPPNIVTPLSQIDPPAYPTCWDTWQYIEVEYELTVISFVTRLLLSPQKGGLMGCTTTAYKPKTLL